MRPDARAASAIEIVDQWLASETGLDRLLAQWGRSNRYAGSGDRAAIADLVYGSVRCLRSADWISGNNGKAAGRSILHGYFLQQEIDPSDLFTGAKHAPALLSDAEFAAMRKIDTAPRPVRLDYPDWLQSKLADIPDADLAALRQRAPLDLRVNALKATPTDAIAVLKADGVRTTAIDGIPLGLRVIEGARKVARSRAYIDGQVEIQDAGSQALASLASPMAGELIIDLCAGGGGKALAMASESMGQADIVAHDISIARMTDLPSRAERAGAFIKIAEPGSLGKYRHKADLVFIDAPCSGSGAWRRNPDAKWRLTTARLDELFEAQAQLLQQAIDLCRPSGRIVYGTCSLLEGENMAQVDAFTSANQNWQIDRTFQSAPSAGMDGLFGAVLSQALDSR